MFLNVFLKKRGFFALIDTFLTDKERNYLYDKYRINAKIIDKIIEKYNFFTNDSLDTIYF